MVHRRLFYIYLLIVPSSSSRYFNKIKLTSRLGRLLALSLEILTCVYALPTFTLIFFQLFLEKIYFYAFWKAKCLSKCIKLSFFFQKKKHNKNMCAYPTKNLQTRYPKHTDFSYLAHLHLGQHVRFWYLLHWQAGKAHVSLCICVVSPEPSFLEYTKYVST